MSIGLYQTLFPRSGDVIHPQLWESGSGYETRGGGGVGEGLSATHWEWNVENVEKGISHLIKLMKQ